MNLNDFQGLSGYVSVGQILEFVKSFLKLCSSTFSGTFSVRVLETRGHLLPVSRLLGTESSLQRWRNFRGLSVTVLRHGSQRSHPRRNEAGRL
jgi:hypothetical protein